jgi:hypothetical protein
LSPAIGKGDGMSKEQKEKPRKKDPTTRDTCRVEYSCGYNQACNDWEEYLSTRPKVDVGEIKDKLIKLGSTESVCLRCGRQLYDQVSREPEECPYCRCNRLQTKIEVLEKDLKHYAKQIDVGEIEQIISKGLLSQCVENDYSSRTCELGTKCCVVKHSLDIAFTIAEYINKEK